MNLFFFLSCLAILAKPVLANTEKSTDNEFYYFEQKEKNRYPAHPNLNVCVSHFIKRSIRNANVVNATNMYSNFLIYGEKIFIEKIPFIDDKYLLLRVNLLSRKKISSFKTQISWFVYIDKIVKSRTVFPIVAHYHQVNSPEIKKAFGGHLYSIFYLLHGRVGNWLNEYYFRFELPFKTLKYTVADSLEHERGIAQFQRIREKHAFRKRINVPNFNHEIEEDLALTDPAILLKNGKNKQIFDDLACPNPYRYLLYGKDNGKFR